MNRLFPAEANHYLEIDALCHPNIHFFGARVDHVYQACGALAIKDGYGELKSIYTSETARGQGLAQKLLNRLEKCAVELGTLQVKLETGSLLDAAHRLYQRQGYTLCGPFGSYERSKYSLYMEKHLAHE